MELVPGYKLETKLHEGHGTVLYRGTQPLTGTTVIIKLTNVERPSARGRSSIEHEYAILKDLRVPNVVRTRAFERFRGGVALVLEHIPNPSLNQTLASRRLELRTVLEITCRVARILAALHAAGIVHKDIKPHNILCNVETLEVHIIDFGIAMHTSNEMQASVQAETRGGSLAYMSPEQTGRMNRKLDRRTDLYSLGVTLYECLLGRRPFVDDEPLALIHSHIARSAPAPHELDSTIPEVVSQLTMKLLAKAAEDRYQSAAGLLADLERCLASLDDQGAIEDFELATRDHTGELDIPQKLYGRAAELTELHDAFARVREGASEFILVAGYSGIGKSALVNEIHRPLTAKRGIFAAGKFDQYNRATPYSSIGAAFGTLVRLILSEHASRLETWKTRLRAALGSNGQVLIELIPELELIIGPQPTVSALGPTESQNRFNLVFRRFVDVLADAEHPFVLFLDDLQWADHASLRLIQSLLADHARRHFLLIGAYRDNEVDRAHPLSLTLDSLREAGVEPRTLLLAPLQFSDVGELLAESLQTERDSCADLARVIHTKTNGNPFFVNQFVRALSVDGLLGFDWSTRTWRYDIASVEERGYTDNVVDFIAAKIHMLPATAREVLSLAACIGFDFDLHTLATIHALPANEIHSALWLAIEHGLLVALQAEHQVASIRSELPTQEFRCRFLHDRVQQAAYNLVEQDRRHSTHLQIGRLLLAARDELDQDSRLFEIVNHLNHGVSLISSPDERRTLAVLNLRTGRRAKSATAYEGASGYLSRGIALLPETAWESAYELCFDLHREFAECEYLCSRLEPAEALFRDLIERARDELDRVDVNLILLRLYQIAGRYKEAVSLGYEALRTLGVHLPEEVDAINEAIGAEAVKVRENLGDRSVASLIDAPRMTDPRQKRIMGLLTGIMPSAYIARPEVFPLAALWMTNFSLKHGNTEESCLAYSVYGLLSVGVFADIPGGFEFSEMCLALNEKLGDPTMRGMLLHVHNCHINFWSHHFRTNLPILERGFHACLEAGDLAFASYIAYQTPLQAVERGETPDTVRRLAERCKTFATQTKNHAIYETIRIVEQYVAFIEGKTDEQQPLKSEGYDEEKSLALVNEFGPGVAIFHTFMLMALYTKRRHAEALTAARAARPMLPAVMAMMVEATFYFYEALALLIAPDASADSVAEHLGKFELWATHCPENFESRLLLIKAEVARVSGAPEAAALYENAIESARVNEFVQYEALGNELAGRYFAGLGCERLASMYMTAAHISYTRWGAIGVAAALMRQHGRYILIQPGGLLHEHFRQKSATDAHSATPVTSSSTQSSSAITLDLLDVATVVEAALGIAQEIRLPNLLKVLIRVLMQSAGADRAAVLMMRDEQLMVVAEARSVETIEVYAQNPIPVTDWTGGARSMAYFVQRTRTVEVVGDAQTHSRYGSDPHVQTQGVRSLLGLPVDKQGQCMAVLYLENRKLEHSFTRDQVSLLRVLAGQIAISLENARLYGELEQAMRELTKSERLKHEFLATISHELLTPLNAIINLPQILLSEAPESGGRLGADSPTEMRDMLMTIQVAGQQLLFTINQMILFSRLEAATLPYAPAALDIAHPIAEAVASLESEARDRAITVRVDTAATDDIQVRFDARLLPHIVGNLLSNAIKFSSASSTVHVTTGLTDDHVELSVRDTGPGIPEENRELIFESFRQSSAGSRRRHGGMGLGLTVASKLVSLHRGAIVVDSRPGEGCDFTVRLPRHSHPA